MGIRVRFWIGCMIFLATFTCYTIRVNLSVLIVSMTKGKTKGIPYCIQIAENTTAQTNKTHVLPDYGPRFDWDERVQGQLLGAYFYGYIATNLFAGAIAEYCGPVKAIGCTHILSALINSCCILAAPVHWAYLFLCRLLLGMGGALIYPSLQMLISYWAPPNEKGKFSGALMGNVLGTCVTWPVVGLVTKHIGWDWGFQIVSIENIIFSILFFIIVSDTPDTHKWISEDEINYIKESQHGTVTRKKVIDPYLSILLNIPFWMLVICQFSNEWGLYFQMVLVPKFISDVIGYDLDAAGVLSALPSLMRLIFGLSFGAIADALITKEVCRKVTVRKSFTISSHVIPGIMLIIISFMGCNFLPVMILLTLSLGFNGAVVENVLINAQDLAPNFAGTIYSITSFFAGMTGFVVPALNAEFTKDHNGTDEWAYTFIIAGIVYCTGGIIWMLFGSVEEQSFNRKGET